MNVERIIVETNDETCNNPVEYDWEFDPDGVSHMTGEGDIPSGADDSTAIVETFGHIAESIVDGERVRHVPHSLEGSSRTRGRGWRFNGTFP